MGLIALDLPVKLCLIAAVCLLLAGVNVPVVLFVMQAVLQLLQEKKSAL